MLKKITPIGIGVDHLYDEIFMAKAIKQARKVTDGQLPAGAVIVRNGKVVGKGWASEIRTGRTAAHAELLAIEGANKKLRRHRLEDCTIYCTHEPCQFCASGIFQAGIKEIVYGVSRKDMNVRTRKNSFQSLVDDCGYEMTVTCGVLEEEILRLTEESDWGKVRTTDIPNNEGMVSSA